MFLSAWRLIRSSHWLETSGLLARGAPFLAVRSLLADAGGFAVAGANGGVRGQGQQLVADRLDDHAEVGVGPPGRAGPAVEQGVAAEHGIQVGGVEAARAGRVSGSVQDL